MGVIHLTTKKEMKSTETSQMVFAKFIEACQTLDASIFEPFIEEDQIFENVSKFRFLANLKLNFSLLKKAGVNSLELGFGKCGSCLMGHKTYEFTNPTRDTGFAYIIEEGDGLIADIFQCRMSRKV